MEHHCKGLEAVQLFIQEAMGGVCVCGGGLKENKQQANKKNTSCMHLI